MDGQGRERLERLDVGSVVRTVFLLSVFVAFVTGVLAFGAWHALAALDLVRGVEELVGELAGGVFRIDRSNFAGAFVGLEGLLVVTATAFAGIGDVGVQPGRRYRGWRRVRRRGLHSKAGQAPRKGLPQDHAWRTAGRGLCATGRVP